jgi:hypothetical protein
LDTRIIPKDSILHNFIHILSKTEVPLSYQIGVGLSAIGGLLRRQIWIDQHATADWGWNVYPNQSILLIGPSGVGKDTAINFGKKTFERFKTIQPLGGTTIESFYHRMSLLSNPACAYQTVGEMTALLGKRDYQSGIVQGLTDLMSGNDELDVSTKTDLTQGAGPKIIRRPTLTLWCGSTEEWLHKVMPDGALEGGFLGRFLILVEKMGTRQIPLTKYEYSSSEEKKELGISNEMWYDGVGEIIERCQKGGEVVILQEARDLYTNWYYNRFKYFSKTVMPYANRSRDTVLRLAMLMGCTRRHWGYVDEDDMKFGVEMIREIGQRIDSAIIPPTLESQCASEILSALPISDMDLVRTYGKKYNIKQLEGAKELLRQGGEIQRREGKWHRVKGEL